MVCEICSKYPNDIKESEKRRIRNMSYKFVIEGSDLFYLEKDKLSYNMVKRLVITKDKLSTVQYSYDLTVNSFRKVFVHVQNCLLMKKMSDVQKSNRGRTKTLTDSTRKRHKKENLAKIMELLTITV
jgi:hypothetical protein